MVKKIVADFHIHSMHSHATSKFMDLAGLSKWAQLKGITVMGTGDFTHPAWIATLKENLEEKESGLFGIKDDLADQIKKEVYLSCRSWQRFILSTEISTVFKRNGRSYRSHSIILAPSFQVVDKITTELALIGSLQHDGRPILGLDVKDLLKIVLEASPQAMLIPAHIWTPWYGLLGSKSGFNSIQEAFQDLTPHIFAVEKGLSSSVLMNGRVSQLDHITILANSDAHSLENLGREANILHAQLSYDGIIQAIKNGKKIDDGRSMVQAIEFFPEHGKYYADGHRACGIMLMPEQTIAQNGICAVCGKLVTIGVLNRINQLANRSDIESCRYQQASRQIVPLREIIQRVLALPKTSKKIDLLYHQMISSIGNEFYVLLEAPVAIIASVGGMQIAQAIEKIRVGAVVVQPGYDGVYGCISL